METTKELYPAKVLANVQKIMNINNLRQFMVADAFGLSESQCSKILNGKAQLTLQNLSDFAKLVGMREIDILTYPERFVPSNPDNHEVEPVEATLQIRLKKDKKDQVLKLVFGENNLEILNR